MAVVDASVVVAVYLESDTHHAASARWLDSALREGEPLFAPAILLAEVAGAIARNVGNATLAERVVSEIISDQLITLIAATEQRSLAAATIAWNERVRGCDSLYIALAAELGETLVTTDLEQRVRGAAVARTLAP